MLVQDRPTQKPTKNRPAALPTLHPDRFSESKSLDFSTWLSDNLYKIFAICLLIATVAALFFLCNVGDSAALLCFQSQSKTLETIHFPQIDWNSITTISDKSTPFANFRSDNWIVVSVSGHEEYYTEVFGGKQYIQQGISNGLPDVDSIFYFTRKPGLEGFDIKFDDCAPKVALPQGVIWMNRCSWVEKDDETANWDQGHNSHFIFEVNGVITVWDQRESMPDFRNLGWFRVDF